MGRLCQTDGLTDDQTEILKAVRTFVEREDPPGRHRARARATSTRTEIVEGLKELGIFGLMIPEEYDGLGESLLTYALAVEEIARGWMSVAGIINTHFIVAYMLLQHGTEEQKQKYLPRMATGEVRGAFSMSRAGLRLRRRGDQDQGRQGDDGGYEITGQKMWLTNGGSSNLVAVLVKTDEGADSVYRNMTTFLVEKEPGFGETAQGVTIPGKIDKMGYKGVDTTEMVFEGHRISADQILGGEPGKGFYQMMDGVEVGRVNVAARGCGVANRAFELGVAYAQQRETFGKKIAEHQAILFRLAEMATKVETAHAMMVTRRPDQGPGRAQRRRGRHGEVPRLGVLQRGRRGLLPDPRRLRLLQGVRDRAPLPRGAVPADRRGHRRHPEDDHRPPAARGLQAVTQPPTPRFVFVVTYGRSGSTLTQGMLNTLPRTLVRGENNLYLLPMFRAYASLETFKDKFGGPGAAKASSAFYGLREVDLDAFAASVRQLVQQQLLGDVAPSDVDRLGFKEVLWHRIKPEEWSGFFGFMDLAFDEPLYVLNRRDVAMTSTSGFWQKKEPGVAEQQINRVRRLQDFLRESRPDRCCRHPVRGDDQRRPGGRGRPAAAAGRVRHRLLRRRSAGRALRDA